MFFRLPTLTPGYIRLLQVSRAQTVPGVAMLLGAVGIGMCGYSSKQLALHHRPSTRVLHWVGTHTDAGGPGTATHRTPVLDVTRRAPTPQEIPPPSFVGQKFP
uniref:Uncharacterized protein n=1 Tax=Fundulus heteroclitus TaxID=8078 RepID=A0A3Q2QI62_FUNHE